MSVPLHKFCESCEQFLSNWKVLSEIQQTGQVQDYSWRGSFLCTVAHLTDCSEKCHLCTLLSASLERYTYSNIRTINGENVYLYIYVNQGSPYVDALSGHNMPIGEDRRNRFGVFSLQTYHRSEVLGGFHQHIVSTSIPLLARDNVGRAEAWIDTCIEQHTHCRDFQMRTAGRHERPTRVLEVTETTARLRCDMFNEVYEYLVLSHMWGENNEKQLRLLEADLESFQLDIPWNGLNASMTFREAIRVTCKLGYRYLWIDSLCIIQDSDSDWTYEASRMAIVYGNAACNLAYLFPPDASSQPQTRPDPRTWNPCILRSASSTAPGIYIEHSKVGSTFTNEDDGKDWLIQRNWPLFHRAWTFQEYLLSPRTLIIGHKNLMFHCSELFYDEILGPIGDGHGKFIDEQKAHLGADLGKSKYFPATLEAVSTARSLSSVVALSFMIDWWKVVNGYRVRRLTFPKDRVIAFAGVARAFQRVGGLTYLAGLWKEVLPLCLLWYIEKKGLASALEHNDLPRGTALSYPPTIREDVVSPAPAWSWCSTPIYAFHELQFVFNEDELSARRKSNRVPPVVCFDDIFWATTPSFQFGLNPVNDFSDSGFWGFADLRITLSTKTMPVRVNWPADLLEQINTIKSSTTHPDDQEFECEPAFEYYPDAIPENKGRKMPKSGIRALVAELQIVRTAGFTIHRRLAGLVLIPGEESGTWKRVGVWKLKMRISGVHVDLGSMHEVAKRWREYEFVSSQWRTETLVLT